MDLKYGIGDLSETNECKQLVSVSVVSEPLFDFSILSKIRISGSSSLINRLLRIVSAVVLCHRIAYYAGLCSRSIGIVHG